MAQNFIGLKGNIQAQTQIPQLQQQIAEAFVNNQLQNVQTPQNNNRATVEDLINSTLTKQIDIPRFTTIQDIVNAPKGEKLKTFGEYVENNPDVTRLIGSFLGGTRLDTTRNRFVHRGEEQARRQEAQMQAAQERALDEMKAQSTLAKDMYNAYQQKDIADMNDKRARDLAEQQEKWARERFAQEMALKQLQLNSQISHQRAMEGIARDRLNNSSRRNSGGGVVTGGASGVPNLNNIKMTAAERKQYTENKSTLANIEAGLKAFKKYPSAYGPAKGLLPAAVLNITDPKGIDARAQIDNITAVYRKWLTGAQMSDKERKAYERFLPSPTDTREAIIRKLNSMKGSVQRSNDAILSNYGISSGGNTDPLGLGL